jgi:hypothetical protein
LDEACQLWFYVSGQPLRNVEKLVVPKEYASSLLVFLGRLRGAKEFVVAKTQKDFSLRVVELIDFLMTNESGSDEQALVLTRIADSIDACNDKPVWALNQVRLMQLVSNARGDRCALKSLGRRVLHLEIVHEHAKAKCDRLQFVDDVCVYLRFEIALRDSLDLPVSALSMHFPSYIDVSEEEIKAAEEEALSVTEQQFAVWLQGWQEWQRQDRLEKSQGIKYLDLKQIDASSKRDSWRKSIRDLLGKKPSDTVVFMGQRWSLGDFLRHWVETGRDLSTNSPLSAQDLDAKLFRA